MATGSGGAAAGMLGATQTGSAAAKYATTTDDADVGARIVRTVFDLMKISAMLSWALWNAFASTLNVRGGVRLWLFVALLLTMYCASKIGFWITVQCNKLRARMLVVPPSVKLVLRSWLLLMTALERVTGVVETTILFAVMGIVSDFVSKSIRVGYAPLEAVQALCIVMMLYTIGGITVFTRA